MLAVCCFSDYNDCEIWGICDQLCEDRAETHICSCVDGYFLEQNHICKANVSGTANLCHDYYLSITGDDADNSRVCFSNVTQGFLFS